MDWHVPLLVITAALAASAAFACARVFRAQRTVEHRVAIIGAREAAFIGILQRLSGARKLEDILIETVHAIERVIPDCIGSIQLIEDGKIRNGAAPGLPKFYNDLVEGLPIGEGVGSCGSAAALRKPAIVADGCPPPHWTAYQGSG